MEQSGLYLYLYLYLYLFWYSKKLKINLLNKFLLGLERISAGIWFQILIPIKVINFCDSLLSPEGEISVFS